MSIFSASDLDLSLISFGGSDSTLTWQGGDKIKRRRQEGSGGGGGDYFKYIFPKGVIIRGRQLIKGRLFFEEIR